MTNEWANPWKNIAITRSKTIIKRLAKKGMTIQEFRGLTQDDIDSWRNVGPVTMETILEIQGWDDTVLMKEFGMEKDAAVSAAPDTKFLSMTNGEYLAMKLALRSRELDLRERELAVNEREIALREKMMAHKIEQDEQEQANADAAKQAIEQVMTLTAHMSEHEFGDVTKRGGRA